MEYLNKGSEPKMTMTQVIREERQRRLDVGIRATRAVQEVAAKFRGQSVAADVFVGEVESIGATSPAIAQAAVLDVLGEGDLTFSADGFLHVADGPDASDAIG